MLMLEKTSNNSDKLKFIEEMKNLKRKDDAFIIQNLMNDTYDHLNQYKKTDIINLYTGKLSSS